MNSLHTNQNYMERSYHKKRERNRPLYLQIRSCPPKSAFSAVNVLTSVNAVVCVQLMFQAELFGTVLTLVRLPRLVLLPTGLLLGNIAASSETTSSTGLICAEKKKTQLRISINSK